MIEKLYANLIRTTRSFTNSIDRRNIEEGNMVTSTLTDMINRISFMMRADAESKILENRLIKEMKKLSKEMFVKTNNKSVYLKKLQKNIDYLAWVNKNRKINLSARNRTVGQKEIFFAYLGDNIGSEQNGRRPVIILQNNIGNTKGNTTIVAPVTTHKKSINYDNTVHRYYVKIMQNGIERRKYLDFYEVPLRLENNPSGLYGFVNVMHLREIDRKRIDGSCRGIATDQCFENIIKAITKNLDCS